MIITYADADNEKRIKFTSGLLTGIITTDAISTNETGVGWGKCV